MSEVKRMLNDQLIAVRNALAEKKNVLKKSSEEFLQLKKKETELLDAVKLIDNANGSGFFG